MTELPSGTVTFLFTDIEGSTVRWERHPTAMRDALARHDALLHEGITVHGGVVVTERGEGDSFFALFARPTDALAAACALQRTLATAPWPQEVAPIRVRMALHTGEAGLWEGRDYRGTAVNRCARLRAVAHGGQVLLSGVTYELVRDHLPLTITVRDLGEHRLKDLTRPEHVYQVVIPGVPADFPPLKSLDQQRHNLPVQPTALIGREHEVQEVRERLLDPQTRLLTLTGVGGMGKTRLALQVAAEVVEAFPDGVYFVNLAPISDAALVLPTIAQTLGVIEAGSQPLRETLHAYLHEKRLLLVLDNFEQVLEAAPVVSELLTACAGVRILVTSRAALRLRGERVYAVPPLRLPHTTPLPPLETLTQYEAVRLFIARAQDAKADFAVTNETAPAVAEICARLDGLPLAIELAATRVRLFTPQALLTRLEHRLGVLTGGARDLPERQRTLRAAIDWSYSLLTEEEQTLFARLSVFVGGRTLEAIEAVCNRDGMLDVLAGVDSLLEKSLLGQVEVGEETRFTMLETLHEYARERLAARGEEEALREAHAAYFLALTEEGTPALKGPQQEAWLERLEREHENLRVALGWLRERGQEEQGLRLASALGRFWELRGHWSEGRRWLDDLLDRGARPEVEILAVGGSGVRVAALNVAAVLAADQHDYKRVRALAEESAALARASDDVPGLIDALLLLEDEALLHRFAHDEARDRGHEALALARSSADEWRTAYALHALARLTYRGDDYAQTRALLEESETLFRACGDPTMYAQVLRWLGHVLDGMGEVGQGERSMREALALLPGTYPSRTRALAMISLAGFLAEQDAYDETDALLEQALTLYRALGAPSMVAASHGSLAFSALLQGAVDRAQRHLDESLRLARAVGAADMVAEALQIQGDLLRDCGLYEQAEVTYQESRDLIEPMQIPWLVAALHWRSGVLARRQGQYALARERFARAASLTQETDPRLYAASLTSLGRVAVAQGNVDEAERLLREGLRLDRSTKRTRGIAEALDGLAEVALAQVRPQHVVRLSAGAATIRTAIGAALPDAERVAIEHTLEAARAALGPDVFEATWADAQATPWEVLVDQVLAAGRG